jgi:hypothetical protein
MRKTIRKVMIVVPVLMMSCQFSEKLKNGPDIAPHEDQDDTEQKGYWPPRHVGCRIRKISNMFKRQRQEVNCKGGDRPRSSANSTILVRPVRMLTGQDHADCVWAIVLGHAAEQRIDVGPEAAVGDEPVYYCPRLADDIGAPDASGWS